MYHQLPPNPKISIIIPVYNSSKFLRKCLDSVINQSLKEIEIIIVNDCSPEPTDEEICLEYAAKDPRIIYLKHELNKGAGAARNTGILVAKGKYIGFVDSDDFIHKNMYQVMYIKAIQNKADIVHVSFLRVNFYDEKLQNFSSSEEFSIYDNYLMIKNLLRVKLISSSACDKIIKSELIKKNNAHFPQGINTEDIPFLVNVFANIDNILIIKEPLYYYRINPKSMTSEIRKFHVYSFFKVCDLLAKTFEKIPDNRKYYKELNIFIIKQVFYMLISRRRNRNEVRIYFIKYLSKCRYMQKKLIKIFVFFLYVLSIIRGLDLIRPLIKKLYTLSQSCKT